MERTVRRSLLFLFSAALGFLGWADPALASSFRMVDKDGVVPLTNAPTSPRYQPQPGWSGTASGWLAIPEAVRGRYAQEIGAAAGSYGQDPGLGQSAIPVETGV